MQCYEFKYHPLTAKNIKRPLISIITISLNNLSGLKKTIQSVNVQTYGQIEHIIVDGASEDGTAEYLKNYTGKIALWISEPDNGVYHAMNKGIKISSGYFCLFLNAGDILLNSSILELISKEISDNPDYNIYYADLKFQNSQTMVTHDQLYPESISLNYFSFASLGHPAAFFSREILVNLGGYMENYQIISDWALFVQAFLRGYTFKHLPIFCSVFEIGGLSYNVPLLNQEHREILNKEFRHLKMDFESLTALRKFENSKSHTLLNVLLKYAGFRK